MNFNLEKLPYDLGALEPHISKETLEYHYGKHHQSYVTNLTIDRKYKSKKRQLRKSHQKKRSWHLQ